jgi:hypothetical protein
MSKKILVILVVFLVVAVSFVGGKKLAVLPGLMKPVVIAIQENELFILDGVEVYVYSLRDYRLLTKFGKKGQGPGELVPDDEIPLQLRLVDGNIFLNSQTKMIYYSKDGKMIKEKSFTFPCMQIVPLGEGFAVVKSITGDSPGIKLAVVLCDAQLKPLKTLVSFEKDEAANLGRIVIPTPYIYLHGAEDTLFVWGGIQRDFDIKVFDKRGNPLPAIRMPYDRLELTGSFKDELMEWFKTGRFGSAPAAVFQRIYFLDDLPAVRDVVVTGNRGGSRVYVQTYKQQANGSEFFVFDYHGKRLNRVFLPTASGDKIKLNHETLFTFDGNRYYYLVDNLDNEEWELHMETLN